MALWHVSGTVVGSTYVGEFEAETASAALGQAWKKAGITLCHECAREVSDPEVNELVAENVETGEAVADPALGESASETVERWQEAGAEEEAQRIAQWLRTVSRAGVNNVLISIHSSQDIARLADSIALGRHRGLP